MEIRPSDPRLRWAGAVSLEINEEWVQPWRIHHNVMKLYDEGHASASSMPAGVRIAFATDATEIHGKFVGDGGKIDLTVDHELVGTCDLASAGGFSFTGLVEEKKIIELWLPQANIFKLASLGFNDGASVQKFDDHRPKWITYGSSISHCGSAESPAFTWPAVVARKAGFNHTNLGVGGQCHLDIQVAHIMRDLPADYLSMCVGINIQGGATLNQRTYASSIIGFVQIVREKHPEAPFVIMSPIISAPRETVENAVGLSLEMMRVETEGAVKALRDYGDTNVHYVDGLDVFGAEQATPELLPDELHPSAEGYKLMGERFHDRVVPEFFTEPEG